MKKKINKVWNVIILTAINKVIYRRYTTEVTHEEVYLEYKQKDVVVANSLIHHSAPMDFFDWLRTETDNYSKIKYGVGINKNTMSMKTSQTSNEYIAEEVTAITLNGDRFTIPATKLG